MRYKEIIKVVIQELFGELLISDIQVDESKYYAGVNTEVIIRGYKLCLSIKVPISWETSLIELAILNYKDIPFVAHLGQHGKLCLFDMEGVLWGLSFKDTCEVCLRKMLQIIDLSDKDEFMGEVLNEFEFYWQLLPNIKLAKMINEVEGMDGNSDISFYIPNRQNKAGHKDNKGRDKEQNLIYVSDKTTNLVLSKAYPNAGTKHGAILLICSPKERINPPDWKNTLSIEYINSLIEDYKSDSEIPNYLASKRNSYNIIFVIPKQDGNNVVIGVILKNYIFTKDSKFRSLKNSSIIPLYVKSVSHQKLIQRGGAAYDLYNKRVLIVGCGSIGGYLIDDLVKIGITDITLVDSDDLDENNVYRHRLGYEYLHQNKAHAFKEYYKRNLPFVNISAIQSDFEYAFHNGRVFLDEFDVIVSAVGNSNFNLYLNKLIYEDELEIPVLYLWNEIMGIGSHAFLGVGSNRGCLNCIFQMNMDGYLENKSSYAKPNQAFTKQLQGCGTSFIPYSSLTSIKTATIGTELLLEFFGGGIEESVLRSMKGDKKAFIREGYELSNAYNNQLTIIEDISAVDFARRDCELCRKKISR